MLTSDLRIQSWALRTLNSLPAIAAAAVLGIIVNAIFLIFKPRVVGTEMPDEAVASAD